MHRQLSALIISMLVLTALGFHWPAALAEAQEADPNVQITFPTAGSMVVQGLVPVTGTANMPRIRDYVLEYRALTTAVPASSDWLMIYKVQGAVQNGNLAFWDTTLVMPGTYELRLSVTSVDCADPTIFLVSPLGIGVEPTVGGTVPVSHQAAASTAQSHMGVFAASPAESTALLAALQGQFANLVTAIEPGALVPVTLPDHPLTEPVWAHGYDVSSPQPPFDLAMLAGHPLGPDVRYNAVVITSGLADALGVRAGQWLTLQIGGTATQFEIVGIAAAPCHRMWLAWQSVAWLMNWTVDGGQVPQGYYIKLGNTPPDASFLATVADMVSTTLAAQQVAITAVSLVPGSDVLVDNTGIPVAMLEP